MTAEEMSELMYKPLPGEWGERSREEECDRIITGIDQLITVGVCLESRHLVPFSHIFQKFLKSLTSIKMRYVINIIQF